jgi:hypothetical protein
MLPQGPCRAVCIARGNLRPQLNTCVPVPLLLQVFLWDVASGGVIRKFRGHDSRVNAVRAHALHSIPVSNSVRPTAQQQHCFGLLAYTRPHL